MKDIPGTITDRFTLLLTSFFEVGEVISSTYSKALQIEKRIKYEDMIGAEYRVAVLIEGEELDTAMTHYNFLRKYKLV